LRWATRTQPIANSADFASRKTKRNARAVRRTTARIGVGDRGPTVINRDAAEYDGIFGTELRR
jgi:hypothetical protein